MFGFLLAMNVLRPTLKTLLHRLIGDSKVKFKENNTQMHVIIASAYYRLNVNCTMQEIVYQKSEGLEAAEQTIPIHGQTSVSKQNVLYHSSIPTCFCI